MLTVWTSGLLLALAVPGAGDFFERNGAGGEAALQARLRGLVAGPPLTCVSARQLRESDVINGVGIVYETTGSRRYVNRPHGPLDRLKSDYIIAVRSPSSQLCDGQPIDLLGRAERLPVASLTLGAFVPYDRPKRRR